MSHEEEFEFTPDEPSFPAVADATSEDPEAILRRKADRIDMEAILRNVLEGRISTAVDQAITGRIEREVDAIFEEGWVATNQWGEPENNSKPVAIRARIAALLTKNEGYGRGSKLENILHKAIERAVETAVETERRTFQTELKAWKSQKMSDKLRAALDGSIF